MEFLSLYDNVVNVNEIHLILKSDHFEIWEGFTLKLKYCKNSIDSDYFYHVFRYTIFICIFITYTSVNVNTLNTFIIYF